MSPAGTPAIAELPGTEARGAGAPCGVSPASMLRVESPVGLQLPWQRFETELGWFDDLNRQSNILSIWQPHRALAVTALEAAMPHFAAATAAAAARGFPVQVRKSGGGCVCLGPGTLVISHLYCSATSDIDRSYRDFAAKLIAATARLRLALRIGQIPAAYCDGRFDLSWNGLKVGGIAQRRRARAGHCNIWVHAVLCVEESSLVYPREVEVFYRTLRTERTARHALTTALARCAVSRNAGTDLMARCTAEIVRVFAVSANKG